MISDETLKNKIRKTRAYVKLNESKVYFSSWVDIGDGDVFQFTVECFINRVTGNVRTISGIRFRGRGGIVYPGRNCGYIDLDHVSDEVLNRYRSYEVSSQFRYRERKILL